jgi:hypothetical protein
MEASVVGSTHYLYYGASEEENVPVLLKPDEVPHDVMCSICISIPVKPVLTPCDHMFCFECLQKAVHTMPYCPIDRKVCQRDDIVEVKVGSFPHRIWSAVDVKCGKYKQGCVWTGSIADFEDHCTNCEPREAEMNSRSELHDLEAEVIELFNKGKGNQLQARNAEVEMQVRNAEVEMQLRNAEVENTMEIIGLRLLHNLDRENTELKAMLAENDGKDFLPKIFNGSYRFGRYDVLLLSQLIARHLLNKPSHIESRKIFNCVRSCYMDLQKYDDNPEFYDQNMRMLLSICFSSTWFTDKQTDHIWAWLCERNWS